MWKVLELACISLWCFWCFAAAGGTREGASLVLASSVSAFTHTCLLSCPDPQLRGAAGSTPPSFHLPLSPLKSSFRHSLQPGLGFKHLNSCLGAIRAICVPGGKQTLKHFGWRCGSSCISAKPQHRLFGGTWAASPVAHPSSCGCKLRCNCDLSQLLKAGCPTGCCLCCADTCLHEIV